MRNPRKAGRPKAKSFTDQEYWIWSALHNREHPPSLRDAAKEFRTTKARIEYVDAKVTRLLRADPTAAAQYHSPSPPPITEPAKVSVTNVRQVKMAPWWEHKTKRRPLRGEPALRHVFLKTGNSEHFALALDNYPSVVLNSVRGILPRIPGVDWIITNAYSTLPQSSASYFFNVCVSGKPISSNRALLEEKELLLETQRQRAALNLCRDEFESLGDVEECIAIVLLNFQPS